MVEWVVRWMCVNVCVFVCCKCCVYMCVCRGCSQPTLGSCVSSIFSCTFTYTCRYGDRLLMVNGQDFQSISRKKAAEILRSCDQLSLTMEISRIVSKLKPRAMVSYMYWCIHVQYMHVHVYVCVHVRVYVCVPLI